MPPRRSLTALAFPAVVAAVLRTWSLGAVGFGNQYYAATVKSMTTSAAAFLYGSFDPQLFVSVDKPAPGLWVQAIAARVFGFAPLSLLLPQAIAGVISVALLGRIVARDHGLAAGVIAATALAVAPVAVAVDRNNTMDAQLVLVLLLAAWCALRSLTSGARWLLLAGALVGIGFEIKMSQAYVAAPAIALTYLVGARPRVLARIAGVLGFGAVTIAISALWVVFVDLTPADARPYVGSSTDNTALELAMGHNGLERLPQELLFWRRPSTEPAGPPPAGQGPQAPPAQAAPAPQPPIQPPGQGPIAEAGENGPLRLFNEQLAGQISWYIPLALAGAAAAFARDGRRWPMTPAQASTFLWLAWLLPAAILFSWSGIFHRYYLVMLAPPLAALVGTGALALLSLAREHRTWHFVALGTAVVTAALTAVVVTRAGYAQCLIPVATLGAIASVLALLAPVRRMAIAFALASFFAAPVVWAATTLVAFDGGLPYAGPELLARATGPGPIPLAPIGPPAQTPSRLFDLLMSEYRGERWLAATSSEMTAASLMLRGDVAVMALGGFSGGDPILTPSALEAKVRAGEVRFVVIEDRMRVDLGTWVRSRCAPLPPERVGFLGPQRPGEPLPGVFDCARVRSSP
jgi:4-amino-4-deoxy-L-arabinose transferase-like glycosyltransferase